MSKLADALRAMRVFNDHALLMRFAADRRMAVCVSYIPHEAQMVNAARSQVSSPFFKTDPRAHWSDHGCKTFVGNRAESMPLALAWAQEKYGVSEWAPSPFGGAKVPKEIRDAAKRAVLEAEAKRG